MRPAQLINKYGEDAKRNAADVRVFIEDDMSAMHERFPALPFYTGIRLCNIFIKDRVDVTDLMTVDRKHYRVLKSEEVRVKGKTEYSDVMLFEDDFTHAITIHKQHLIQNGLNLPSVAEGAIIGVSARIETASRDELLQYTGRNGMVATHTFTIIYRNFDLQGEDLIKFGSRSFEVLGFENVDEQNRLLVISTIEVLNA